MQGDSSKPERQASAKKVIATYWSHVRRYRLFVPLLIVFGLGLQIAELTAPWYLRNLFNSMVTGIPGAVLAEHLFSILWLVVAAWFAAWALRRLQDFTNMYYSAKVMAEIYDHSFNYLLGHSYNFFISRFAGSLTHRVSKFTRAFEIMWDAIWLQFLPTAVFVVGAVAVLTLRNLTLGLSLAAWVVIFLLLQAYIAQRRQPLRRARADADTRVTGSLADAISNHSTIMLFAGRAAERNRFADTVGVWRAMTLKSWMSDGYAWTILGLCMLGIQVGLLYGAIILWRDMILTVGDLILIQSYLLVIFDRLVGINMQLRRFYDAFADAADMVGILETPYEIKDKRGAKPLSVAGAEVWFDNVNFSFTNRPVLRDFNLKIAGGEKIALVGPSGAGKSTVTKLLLRLYDLREGEIKIDNQNIAAVTQDSLREAIAFVPQEPILFHRTLMENIRYGRRDATDEEVIEAAKKAHCHEFIQNLPQRYDTYVGERGIKLSGGERQRVAIARAILKNAPILVLDEATSSLDSESEALIQDALEVLMQGKTVMVIAHRLSTIMKMDRIVVMEGGRIAAQGTHLELIRERGLYQKLWSIQAGGFIGGSDEEEVPPADGIVVDTEELAEAPEDK